MSDLFENLRITPHRFRTDEGLPTTLEVAVTDEGKFSRVSMLGGIAIGTDMFTNPYRPLGEALSSPHQECADLIKRTEGSVLLFTREGSMPSFFVRPGLVAKGNIDPTLQQIYEIISSRTRKHEANQGKVFPERRLSDFYSDVDVSYLSIFYTQIMKETSEFRMKLLMDLSSKNDISLEYNAVIRSGLLLNPPRNEISAMMLGRILAHIVDMDTLKTYERRSPHAENYLSKRCKSPKISEVMMERVFSKLCEDIGLEQSLKSQ